MYQIIEDPSNKHWSFVVKDERSVISRHPSREEAQAEIDRLAKPVDHNNAVWEMLEEGGKAYASRFSHPLPEPLPTVLPIHLPEWMDDEGCDGAAPQ